MRECRITSTPKIARLLEITKQPAHAARVLHYLQGLHELNEGNIERLIDAEELWMSSPIQSITMNDQEGHYLHKIRLLAMWLQFFNANNVLIKEKFDFLIAPENGHLLESPFIFQLLRENHYPMIILESLMLLENKNFLEQNNFWNNLRKLKSILQQIPSNTLSVTTEHISQFIQILLIPGNTIDQNDRLIEDYLMTLGVDTSPHVGNEQHIKNIVQIKKYLTDIGFYTEINQTAIDEIFADPDYSSLYSLTINGRSLASQIILIPGDLFINQDVWEQLLQCCRGSDPRETLEKFITAIHQQILENTLNESEPSDFDQLIDILIEAEEAENTYKNIPNSLAGTSIVYKSPNFFIIGQFKKAIEEKDIHAMRNWLTGNAAALQQGKFGIVFNKQLKKRQPFNSRTIAELTQQLSETAASQRFKDSSITPCFT